MTSDGDSVTVMALVRADRETTFEVFTEEIDRWWRRGLAYRLGRDRSVVHLEPRLGGGLFESFTSPSGKEHVKQTGTITVWEPPSRLVLTWRAVSFAPNEETEVEVRFEESASGTRVTLVHRGWSKIRPDHPARHGQDVAPFLAGLGQWWGGLAMSLREHVLVRAPTR